ncbi:MAG: beta-ketoacyl-ACP synthase II [Oscillospiraceae bacterium]
MNRVVVTGLGGISPIGNTIEETYSNAIKGVCGIGFITKFDTTEYKVSIAGEVKDFDPSKYMEKSDIRKSDLYTKYAMAAATMAVEDSQIEEKIDSDRFGVYMGSGIGGFNSILEETNKLFTKGPSRVSPFFIPMMIGNIAAGMIAIKYKAMGPSLPVVTACATSTNTIGEAYRAIERGDADAIIAGGSEASICTMAIAGFSNMMALSKSDDPKNASIPFDARRNGFVMGEGAAALVVESLDHALARGAKIYGEICGYANTNDAYHITSPDPDGKGATNAIKNCVNQAQFDDVSKIYFNAHGTSTPLNDKCETAAIKNVFGDDAYKISISSTKSMTGHMLGAAGAIEAAICLKTMENGIIPPTIGYKEKDPDCDLDYTVNQAIEKEIDYAISTSLGFGGHNACLAFKKYK